MTAHADLNLLTVPQAAAVLGVTPGRIRQLIATGRLPTLRIGYPHLIRPADLAGIRWRRTRPTTSSASARQTG